LIVLDDEGSGAVAEQVIAESRANYAKKYEPALELRPQQAQGQRNRSRAKTRQEPVNRKIRLLS